MPVSDDDIDNEDDNDDSDDGDDTVDDDNADSVTNTNDADGKSLNYIHNYIPRLVFCVVK